MSAKVDMLTPTEAAVVSCVAVRDVNRVIDKKILPKGLYKVAVTVLAGSTSILVRSFRFTSMRPTN